MTTPRSGFWQGWKNEPARVVAFIAVVLQLIVSFGFLDISREQIDLLLFIIAMTLGAGEVTRKNVYPAHKVEQVVSDKTLVELGGKPTDVSAK